MGIAGFWNDMNEPAIFNTPTKTMPLDTVHRIEEPGFVPRTATHAEMHNVFGMLNSRATYEGALKLAPNLRPFVMTRASYAGGHRYAATWTGDNSSSWAHLNLSHGPEHEAIRRRYIEERYRLMPYIYALAEENSRTGLPLMRPVFLEHPEVVGKGSRLGGTEHQFLLGRDLLVAPSPTGESPAAYRINLPSAGWYDYWTGVQVTATSVEETPQIDRLPVFVRPGAILPKQPLVQSTVETPRGNIELAVYPGEDCRGTIYLDDGVSFDYRDGAYLRQSVRCDAHGITFEARQGRFKPWWRGISVVIHGWDGAAPKVALGGKAIAASVDPEKRTLSFTLPDIARAASVAIGAKP